MKTSEYRKPWEENQEEQKINPKSSSRAKNQLHRDILRFAELLPDCSLAGRVHFRFFAAFPLAEEETPAERNGCGILSRPDFESSEKLNQKLLLQETKGNCAGTLFKASIGRYLGLHSVISLKTNIEAFKEEEKSTENNVAKVEAAILHSPTKEEYKKFTADFATAFSPLRVKLSEVKELQTIFDAVENSKFRNDSFKKQFVNYPVDENGELDIEETPKCSPFPFRRKSSKKPILIGKKQIEIAIKHFDAKLEHQGLDKISEKLDNESVELFDLMEDENQKNRFERIKSSEVNPLLNMDCQECNVKDTLRTNGDSHEGFVRITETQDVAMALEYADYHHQGFQKAFSRLKKWCTFEDMEEKVNIFWQYFYLINFVPLG